MQVAEYAESFNAAYAADGNKYGRNCEKLIVEISCGEVVAKGGRIALGRLGNVLGADLGGFAAVPCGILGEFIGNEIGLRVGRWFGSIMFDYFY